MPPLARRAVPLIAAGALLAHLVTQRGWSVVGPIALQVAVLALAAWALHVVVHELGHLAAARAAGFEVRAVRFGPVVYALEQRRLSLSGRDLGGSLAVCPDGLQALRSRLRLVALGGPLATALVTGGLELALRPEALGSPSGILVVMGLFVLVTALLPGWALPRAPAGGTDLEQLLGARQTLAWWASQTVVQRLLEGRRCSQTITLSQLEPLLPRGGPLEPVQLVELIVLAELGAFSRVEARLGALWPKLLEDDPAVPAWLRSDLAGFAACFHALVSGELERARQARAIVARLQAQPWFVVLADAAIAQVPSERAELLERWRAAAEASPARPVAVTANAWVLERMAA